VIEGDARDPVTVQKAIEGADAVIAIISGGGRKDPRQATDAARAIVAGMTRLGVRRLVVTSAYPVLSRRPRLLVWLLRVPYADVAEEEQIVSASDLDWTIVRLNRLTDGLATGKIHTSRELLAAPRSHTRADAATLLLDIVEDPALARTAINVSGGARGPEA
jgi:putative NADH-flavin reductase